MSYYTGEECLICRKKFTDNDDVVVCPECGTPYHRECYTQTGHCVNEALHKSHGSWMAENMAMKKSANAENKICRRCLFPNKADAQTCEKCGMKLGDNDTVRFDVNDNKKIIINSDSPENYYGLDVSETMDKEGKITLGEMADYVDSNKLFYIAVFKRLKNASAKISLNLIAFLFPELYFASRKMYFWATVAFILKFVLGIPFTISNIISYNMLSNTVVSYLQAHPINAVVSNLCRYFSLVIQFVAGLAANALYYRHVIVRLKKLRTQYPDYTRYRAKVKEEGGVSLASMLILLLSNILVTVIFILVVIILI